MEKCKYLLPCGLCEKSGKHCTLTRDHMASIEEPQSVTPGEVITVSYDSDDILVDPLIGMWV